jgi:ubiquinone biosynthesis protein COQ9
MIKSAASLNLAKLSKAALALAVDTPWGDVTLSEICAGTDVSLADCAVERLTKADIAGKLDSDLDHAMLANASKVDTTQSVRDRLFDTLMGRFEAMEDNRAAWVSILDGEKADVLARMARRARRARAGAWALEASGVSSTDLRGAGRAIGLARIMRLVEAVWRDDGPDLAKTMARLDQELRKGEAWVERAQGVNDMVSSFGFARKRANASQDVAAD